MFRMCEDTTTTSAQKFKKAVKKRTVKQEYEISMRLAFDVWSTHAFPTPAAERGSPGDMYENSFEEHLTAKRTAKRASTSSYTAPFQEARNAAASWHPADGGKCLDDVLHSIQKEAQPPNTQQLAFLKHLVSRLKAEILEMQQRTTEDSLEEPLLDLIHGFPGTGKSKLISWMRALMEQGLGWEHGVQFVCLAFQNAMAAQI